MLNAAPQIWVKSCHSFIPNTVVSHLSLKARAWTLVKIPADNSCVKLVGFPQWQTAKETPIYLAYNQLFPDYILLCLNIFSHIIWSLKFPVKYNFPYPYFFTAPTKYIHNCPPCIWLTPTTTITISPNYQHCHPHHCRHSQLFSPPNATTVTTHSY